MNNTIKALAASVMLGLSASSAADSSAPTTFDYKDVFAL